MTLAVAEALNPIKPNHFAFKDELSGLRAKVDTTTEEHSSKERRLVAETESLIVKIRWLEGELEKKDQKVRERSKNVKELMEQIDSERNSVDIKLQGKPAVKPYNPVTKK